ncbi:hypothetical protein C1I94_06165 [Akkermansia muciniphila]|uniref:hypothetical protein n=1 Tax=Akkermansia muciniphila TaxID=239935 RepID=UPI000FE16C07|nr:hypothetical protein [Akkermansia muciniphila]QAA41226.1 hypothetical protein C1I94_06165 [Akkermansia muciniphila]
MCPHCGFSLENLDKKYGKDAIPYRRVCDNAGALRQQDRMKLNALLEKLERRIPPVLLSVYFPNILEPFSLIPHSFWTMNHLTVDEAGFPNHQGPLDPQWLLILVLDVRTDTACFMWGYELDPYVEPDLINKSIMKARIPLRESMLLQAAGSIMKNAVQLVARKARSKVRHPMRYGLTPPTPRIGKEEAHETPFVPMPAGGGHLSGSRPGITRPEMDQPRPAIPDERRVVECQPSLAAPCGCSSRSLLPHAGTRRQCRLPRRGSHSGGLYGRQ